MLAELVFRILNPIIAEHPELLPEGWASRRRAMRSTIPRMMHAGSGCDHERGY